MIKSIFSMIGLLGVTAAMATIHPVQRDVELTKNPVAHLPLQDSIVDVAGNHSVSIRNGSSATFCAGKSVHSKAYELTGANSLRIKNLSVSGDFTFSADYYISDLGVFSTLFDAGFSQNGHVRLAIDDSASGTTKSSNYKNRVSKLEFRVKGNTGGDGRIASGDTMNTAYMRIHEHTEDFMAVLKHERKLIQNWLNVTVVYVAAEKRVDFYLNGKLDSQKFFTTAQPAKINELQIGATLTGSYSLKGKVANIKLYDEALSEAEVRTLDDFRKELWGVQDMHHWAPPLRTFIVDSTFTGTTQNGTPTYPFSTISAAVNALNNLSTNNALGTRILIKPGTYREWDLNIMQDGSRYHPICIEAEELGTVKISGSIRSTSTWTRDSSGIYSSSWTNNWGGSDLETRSEVVHVNDSMLRPYMSYNKLKASPGPGGFYVDEGKNKIYLRTASNPNNSRVEISVNENDLLRFGGENKYGNYVCIRGITFQHSRGKGDRSGRAVNLRGSQCVVVQDCQFIGNGEKGLEVGFRDILIERCTFRNNGTFSFMVSRNSCQVLARDCVVEGACWRPAWNNSLLPNYGSIGKFMYSSHINLNRMRFFDNLKNAVWADSECRDIITDECYFRDNSSNPLFYELSTLNLEVRNSAFYLNGASSAFAYCESFRMDNTLCLQNESDLRMGVLSAGTDDIRNDHSIIPNIYTLKNMISRNNVFIQKLSGVDNEHKLFVLSKASSQTSPTILSLENQFYSGSGTNAKVFIERGASSPIRFPEFQSLINDTSSVMLTSSPISSSATPSISFEKTSTRMPESRVAQPIHLELSEPVEKPITVTLNLQSGSAKEGDDYRLLGEKTLTFEPLERTRTIHIEAFFDTVAEGDESFTISLSNPSGATLGRQSSHVVTIIGSSLTYNVPPSIQAHTVSNSLPVLTQNNMSVTGFDADGDPITYNWEHVSGPAPAQITNAQSDSPTIYFSQIGAYELRLVLSDGRNTTTNLFEIEAVAAAFPQGAGDGSIALKFWDGFPSDAWNTLVYFPGFPNMPTIVTNISELAYRNLQQRFCTQTEGYIIPPVTGDYTFYLGADDRARFWLSTSTSSQDSTLLLETSGSAEVSTPTMIHLVAGQRYYYETQHLQYQGQSHFSLSWETPFYEKVPVSGAYITSTPFDLTGKSLTTTTLITEGDDWRYFLGDQKPDDNWMDENYDDSSWLLGPSGFGYGDGDDATVLDMKNKYTSVMIRKDFPISDLASVLKLDMTIDFDDGYLIYLNGKRIGGANTSIYGVNYNSTAIAYHSASSDTDTPGIPDQFTILPAHVKQGVNSLAIIGLNKPKTSPDFSLIPELSITTVSSDGPVGDPRLDSDNDGMNDFLEIAFGTNPHDPSDRWSPFARGAGNSIDYTVRNVVDGYTYQIETTDDLKGVWTNYQGSLVGDSNGSPTMVNLPVGQGGKRFYRIRVTK